MRYKLDADGYISTVAFGCYLNNCAEYTGAIPYGYNSLEEWAAYACINAYYINTSGDLILDIEKQVERRQQEAQEKIDNAPLLRKDLYGSEEILGGQYVKDTKTGEVIILEDAKPLSPTIKITGIENYKYSTLLLYVQGKNMLPCNAKTDTLSGVTFTRNPDGSITANGTATADIKYTVAGSATNSTPLFALKAGHNYYLNLGGFSCELMYFDGETTAQQYTGASGLLNLTESKEVTQVILKIANGAAVNTTFFPQLEYGTAFTSYEEHKVKGLSIDLDNVDAGDTTIPSNSLLASNDLYPSVAQIDYILIDSGIIYALANNIGQVVGDGNLSPYSGYNTIYALKDTTLEIEYSTDELVYDALQQENFKVSKEGDITANSIALNQALSIENGGTGATTAEAARANLGIVDVSDTHNIKTYSSLAQLGLSGSVTTEAVFKAMPTNSVLQIYNNTTQSNKISDAPYSYTFMRISRAGSSGCGEAMGITSSTFNKAYRCGWQSSNGFGGWKTVTLT